jgi:drug/metabolite transporter (DMT)-like permease
MITGILFGLIGMFGWGISDFLAAQASKTYGSLKTFFWAHIGGLTLLLPAAPWLEEGNHWNNYQVFYCIAGALLYTIVNILLYRSYEKGLVAIVSPVFSAYVIVTVLIGLLIFKERLSSLQELVVILIIAGILLVSTDWRSIDRARGVKLTRGLPEAIGATFLAGFFFSILTVLSRQVGWFGPFLRIRICSFGLACLVMLIIRQNPVVDPRGLRWLIPAGIFDSIGVLAFNLGIQVAPVAIISPLGGSFPLVTILLAMVFLKERPAAYQYVGIGSIITGIIMLSLA